MKCRKLHSVLKILPKSHILDKFFYFKDVVTNFHINYDFLLSKSLNSPNLCIKWATLWWSDCQNKKKSICVCWIVTRVCIYVPNEPSCGILIAKIKKLNLCMLNSVSGFYLCIKWAILWYPDNQLKKKLSF